MFNCIINNIIGFEEILSEQTILDDQACCFQTGEYNRC